jgi:WD40 repeat protein
VLHTCHLYLQRNHFSGTSSNDYVKESKCDTFADIHSSNVIACAILPDTKRMSWVSTGADKSVYVSYANSDDAKSSAETHTISGTCTAPVLCLDINPVNSTILAGGTMDGRVNIIDVETKSIVQTWKEHSKYVVNTKWSPCGTLLASASYDQSVHLYRRQDPLNDASPFSQVASLPFIGAVEAISFLPRSPSSLLVSVRGDNMLRCYDMEKMEQSSSYNMNANGDHYVSFAGRDILCSPDEAFWFINTDRHRVIMFNAGSSVQVRNFYGATNDEFSNPNTALSPSSRYLYSTSQQNNSVVCWDVLTEKVVSSFSAHTKRLRSFSHHPSLPVLATCSFDRTIKLWQV